MTQQYQQSDFPLQSVSPPQQGSTTAINVPDNERIASVAVGVGLLWYGLRNFNLRKIPTLVTGGFLLYRGVSGNCPAYTALGKTEVEGTDNSLEITRTVTVLKPRHEVYQFWRQLENLPLFMEHLEQVIQKDDKHSTWKARVPGGLGNLTWEAEITDEVEDSLLAWHSLPDSTIHNAGRVVFRDAPGGKGTEIQSSITYRPPAGQAGKAVASFLSPVFKQMVKEDMRRLKRYLEAGEIATAAANPTARNKELTNSDEYRL